MHIKHNINMIDHIGRPAEMRNHINAGFNMHWWLYWAKVSTFSPLTQPSCNIFSISFSNSKCKTHATEFSQLGTDFGEDHEKWNAEKIKVFHSTSGVFYFQNGEVFFSTRWGGRKNTVGFFLNIVEWNTSVLFSLMKSIRWRKGNDYFLWWNPCVDSGC